jgi:hypothetical protein
MRALTLAHRLDIGKDPNYFGTLLSCIEVKELPVFVVCTASNIPRTPPEFFRAERFDRVFPPLTIAPENPGIYLVNLAKRLFPTETTCMTAKEKSIYAL